MGCGNQTPPHTTTGAALKQLTMAATPPASTLRSAHNDTINGLTTTFNQTFGIHWDTDNANVSASTVNATSNQNDRRVY